LLFLFTDVYAARCRDAGPASGVAEQKFRIILAAAGLLHQRRVTTHWLYSELLARAYEAQASHGVRARGELHAPGRHLEDVRSACRVEHVRPIEKTRERLAVLAVADEAEAGGWGDVACDAAHAAAPAPKRKDGGVCGAAHNDRDEFG
jgi:hypothetical protein